ncbi:histone-fold-containing protein [Blastocladiella britannica]|nr:histone-fold-containing protein [Blastocladiella britannica]
MTTPPTTTVFPLARIRRIVKADPDISAMSSDAVFVMAKASELFVEKLAWAAAASAENDKRRTVQYKDVARGAKDADELWFLEGLNFSYGLGFASSPFKC